MDRAKIFLMDLSPEILNFLAERREFSEIILAPKASPVERRGGSLSRVMDLILSPEDIRDTLISLRSNTAGSLGPLGKEGYFSFGIPEVGRIRVIYITQRGSYVVSIVKVPYNIPDLYDLVSDRYAVKELLGKISGSNGIVAIVSKSHVVHSLFTYSVLKEICERESKLIYILERPITYLMKHSGSIVIQREVGVDLDSFDKGIEEALFIHPDIIYVNDITLKDGIRSVKKLFDVPILTFLGVTASSANTMRRIFLTFLDRDSDEVLKLISTVIELSISDSGKIQVKNI